jgi:uncharacterized membrane protein YfcA
MSIAIVLILTLTIASIAYRHGFQSNPDAKRANASWYGIGFLLLLFAGLWVAGQADNESVAFGFGIVIFLAFFVMLLVVVASAIGREMRKRQDKIK